MPNIASILREIGIATAGGALFSAIVYVCLSLIIRL
jgi:hypothetical protein